MKASRRMRAVTTPMFSFRMESRNAVRFAARSSEEEEDTMLARRSVYSWGLFVAWGVDSMLARADVTSGEAILGV